MSCAQVQSNALAALEALDAQVAEEVLAEGCITGDRVNGLVDGASGKWCASLFPLLCSDTLVMCRQLTCSLVGASCPAALLIQSRFL